MGNTNSELMIKVQQQQRKDENTKSCGWGKLRQNWKDLGWEEI